MGNIPKLYTGNLIFKYRHTFNQLNHDKIHPIIWQTHTCILKKYVRSSYTKISHLIFSWENGIALPSGINIIGSRYLSFSATGYLKPPFYVWEILLPNRTKPIFHCKDPIFTENDRHLLSLLSCVRFSHPGRVPLLSDPHSRIWFGN